MSKNKIIVQMPEHIGEYSKDIMVEISRFAKEILEKYYPNLTFIKEEDIEHVSGIDFVPLDYFLDNQPHLDKQVYIDKLRKMTLEDRREMILELRNKKKAAYISERIGDMFRAENQIYTVRDDNNKEMWIYQEGIYIPDGQTYILEFVRMLMAERFNSRIAKEVIDKIMADTYVDGDEFFHHNRDVEYIPVQNGLLNIYTRELHPFTPEIIFFNKLPVVYNANAECPAILQFFRDIVRDKADIKTIQQYIGTCLERDNRYERMMMVIGGGRNGKSKFADLVKRFLGSYNCSALQPSSLENPDNFSTYLLHGKFVNMYMDISKSALRNTSLLKSLSGGDQITVPRKFKSPLTFKNTAKFIFGANELPHSFDITDGFWERWLLIDFPYTFVYKNRIDDMEDAEKWRYKERVDDITEKISTNEELSGMLNWALDGLQEIRDTGKIFYKYTPEEVKSIWIRKADSFTAFFMDHLEVDYDFKIAKTELRRAYVEYCKEHRLKIMSDKMIATRMSEEGVMTNRIRTGDFDETVWEGAAFKKEYRGGMDINGIVKYKKMTERENVHKYIEQNGQADKQDLIMRFGEKTIERLLSLGELIEIKDNKLSLHR